MNYLPLFLKVRKCPCLVVGGGEIAARKCELLLKAGADVTVIAPELGTMFSEFKAKQLVEHKAKVFESADLNQHTLVVAATDQEAVNRQVYEVAVRQSIPINTVDSPELCTFILGSIVDRHPITIAISSGGASPVLTRLLKSRIETLIPSAYGRLAELMREFRGQVKKLYADIKLRRYFWEKVLEGPVSELALAGRFDDARTMLEAAIAKPEAEHSQGEVYLIGAGPGDPDLLTFKALRLLQKADVVIYDRLIADGIMNLARRDAERIYVGKLSKDHSVAQEEISELLAKYALEGKRVARLKGGDPFMFGRGGEEIEVLAKNQIPFQIVPGVTAASGCAAYAGIPLTHRDYAQSCQFITGHTRDDKLDLDWPMFVKEQQTLVFYMGLKNVEIICEQLIKQGMRADMPVALVEQGTTQHQKIWVADLKSFPKVVENSNAKPPSLIIIGEVVKLHSTLSWFNANEAEGTAFRFHHNLDDLPK